MEEWTPADVVRVIGRRQACLAQDICRSATVGVPGVGRQQQRDAVRPSRSSAHYGEDYRSCRLGILSLEPNLAHVQTGLRVVGDRPLVGDAPLRIRQVI